jgi:[acyl-carrier-protein] S-malonyltransferase
MQPAAEEMRVRLQALAVQAPAICVYAFDGGLYETPAAIRDGLYRQLFNPVRWSAIVTAMIAAGAQQLIECGPGKVLAGLARRAPGGRDLTINAIDGADTLQAALAAVAGSEN